MSFVDALNLIGPALDDLIQGYKDLNIQIDDATLKGLVLERTILFGTKEAPSGLGKAIAGFQAIVNAAMNLGPSVNTPEARAAQGRTLGDLYTQAQAAAANAGATGNAGTAAALLPFQATLHQMDDWAKKNHIELDRNTQMMIDQSKELGIWNDDYKTENEKLRDSMTNLVTSNDALATALGGLPDELAKIIANPPNRNPAPTKPPPGTPKTEPPPPNAGGGGPPEHTPGDGGPTPTPYATGGFLPYGTDTVPAMLSPGELITSATDAHLLISAMAAMIATTDAIQKMLLSPGLAGAPTPQTGGIIYTPSPGGSGGLGGGYVPTATIGTVNKVYNVTITARNDDQAEKWRQFMRTDGVEITVEEFEDGRYVSRVNRALDR
jgi:hypothetical protein